MASPQPNTFLSRIFGVNSQFPVNDLETELSSIRDSRLEEGSERLLNSSLSRSQRDIASNAFQSDQESSSDEEDDSVLLKPQALPDEFLQIEREDLGDDGIDEEDGEVPLSIMMHAVDSPKVDRIELNNNRSEGNNEINQTIRKGTVQPAKEQIKKSPSPNLQPSPISFNKNQNTSELPTSNIPNREDERARRARFGILNPKERALWKWANVENLDRFLQDVYDYYLGSGYYCILLSRFFELATLAFVVYFSTYLTSCIDYSKLKLSSTKTLDDITVDHCFEKSNFGTKLAIWVFLIFFFLKVIQFYFDAKNLVEVHDFYKYLLEISDQDLQTISWNIVVHRIMELKDQNAITANVSDQSSKSRIDAHMIANRIMRKENYFIAMFNKDVFDLSLPIPFYDKNILTKTLEWNLQLCISGFVFNEAGQIRQQFLKDNKRNLLAEELKRRFILAGVLNIILSPLLVTYFILLYFFRYFNEYKKNPGSIGSRQYTQLAEWKFREFNELYHIFQKRLNLSVPIASQYVDQFPKEKSVIVLKFVAFVSGSFAAVLGILSIVDPDMSFSFEITKGRTVLFYISVFGSIWAMCHNAIPEEYQVYDPEYSLKQIAELTHYMPQHWENKYHTEEVRAELCDLFSLKLVILIREITSLVLTPFILWFSLPKSCNRIVDFFREYSVHVDGLGYVCTFAMFDFQKAKKSKQSTPRGNYSRNVEDKMMKSYLYFLESYGDNEDTSRHGINNGVNAPLQQQQLQLSKKKQPPLSHSIHKKLTPKPLPRGRATTAGQGPGDWNSSSYNVDSSSLTRNGFLGNLKERFKTPHPQSMEEPLGESFLMTLPKTDVNDYRNDDNEGKGPGVLGMVNQFYKDYQISH